MNLLLALLGDALLFGALIWFAGYGALGPATGLRLSLAAKLRLFAEVVALSAVLLYLFIVADRAMGWVSAPPWPGSPPPHRLVALGILFTLGFLYTRRRAQALHARAAPAAADGPAPR
jgi:hypothetical protein